MNAYISAIKYCLSGLLLLHLSLSSFSQDSSVTIFKKVINLKEVVIRNHLNVSGFIDRVQKDTSFYKAFKNLRILGYTALNDIRMIGKKGTVQARLESRTRQSVLDGCRSMELIHETASGDIYDNQRNWNYYTAELYAALFFTKGIICNENNIVKGEAISAKGKTGAQKHKEQLKMLIFSPGTKIPGIPFIGDKVGIFEEEEAAYYDFIIDMDNYQGQNCYLFTVNARADLTESERDNIVINKMTTWFNSETMEIVARNYYLSFNAGIYDFDVHMEVELDKFQEYLVPRLIRYSGNWHAMFKKREHGIFTATLFDFKK